MKIIGDNNLTIYNDEENKNKEELNNKQKIEYKNENLNENKIIHIMT